MLCLLQNLENQYSSNATAEIKTKIIHKLFGMASIDRMLPPSTMLYHHPIIMNSYYQQQMLQHQQQQQHLMPSSLLKPEEKILDNTHEDDMSSNSISPQSR